MDVEEKSTAPQKPDQNLTEECNTNDQQKVEISNTNLIVNYLPASMTSEKFHALFNAIGTIRSCRLMQEKGTGHSLGYGFVDFENSVDAQYAIDILDGLKLENKNIKVSYARTNSEEIKNTNLYVSGLPKPMTEEELIALFSPYGKIITSRILYESIPFSANQEINVSRGIGFIRFSLHHQAEMAINELNGTKISGSTDPLTVKYANSPRSKSEFNDQRFRHPIQSFQKDPFNNILPLSNNNNSNGMIGPLGPIHHQNNRVRFSPLTNDLSPPNVINTGWSIYVSNLMADIEESTLWKLFGPFGAVSGVKIITDKDTNKCKGIAFVTMAKYEEALIAIQTLNGTMLGDRQLQVSFKTVKKR